MTHTPKKSARARAPSPSELVASCHCGAVRLHLTRRPRRLTSCNCSICRRYGCLWAYATRKSVRVECPRGALVTYVWGSGRLAFNHCKKCGCVTHHEHADGKLASTVGANARLLEPQVIMGMRVVHLDGASTWKTLGHSTFT